MSDDTFDDTLDQNLVIRITRRTRKQIEAIADLQGERLSEAIRARIERDLADDLARAKAAEAAAAKLPKGVNKDNTDTALRSLLKSLDAGNDIVIPRRKLLSPHARAAYLVLRMLWDGEAMSSREASDFAAWAASAK